MSDNQPIRERGDKTPDAEVRQRMLGMTVVDVIHVIDSTRPRDTLYLVRADGSAVEIEAERLYLDYVPRFEQELAAIEIVQETTKRRVP